MSKRTGVFLIFGLFFLASALVLLSVFFLRPASPRLTVLVEGGGKVHATGALEETFEAGCESVALSGGEEITLSATGDLSYWIIGKMRVEAKKGADEISYVMPPVDSEVTAVFSEKSDAKKDVSRPDVLVWESEEIGSRALRPFFPSVTQAEDGTILVVYYLADGHALYNQSEGRLSGVLQIVRSTDGGASFSEPETLVDLTDDNYAKKDVNREARDPNLQRLSDGTILLTFPVRAPIGKPGLNNSSGKMNDYWSERSYYMTSVDNGESWSEMKLIECDFFSDEPFLYDDPTRTTGCWVKNGSVAELENGDLIIPLYGAKDCSSRGIYTGVVVRAKNCGDGTLEFYKDWATDEDGNPTDAASITGVGEGNEIALVSHSKTVYALSRTAIPSATEGGVVYRSLDEGLTWERYALEPTENDCLNQPNFCRLSGDLVLVNYSVPLASVASSPARRTARPVYGKLFNVKTGDFAEYDAVTVYDVTDATVADMANPASVLLDDGRIMTVFYDTSAPSTKRGFIGARFTSVSDYVKGEEQRESMIKALIYIN